jgi:hypothetical protein
MVSEICDSFEANLDEHIQIKNKRAMNEFIERGFQLFNPIITVCASTSHLTIGFSESYF